MLNSINYNTIIVLSAKAYMQLPCLALSSNEILSDNKFKDELSESMLIVNVWIDYKASLRTTFLTSQVIQMYLVACQYTYLASVNLSIDDIDECTGSEPPCSWSNGVCENTYGSYLCKCKVGWMLNENSCTDINECTSLLPPCLWSNGKCQNTIGSYVCTCETGWMIGQDNASCVDIDECVTMTTSCSWDNGICQNTNGSYSCSYSNYLFHNSKNVYTLIENTTAILKETCLALIPILYKEYLLTFNIYPNKFNGLYYVICFSLQFTQGNTYCGSTIFDISLNEDGLLTFTKELYPKFQYTIGLNMWSNIEISQTSTIKDYLYKFTIKINNKDVYSIILNTAWEEKFVRIMSFEGVQIEKAYFINKKPNYYTEYYPVISPKGIEMEVIWVLSSTPVVITKKVTKRINGRIGNYQEPLGFWGSIDEGVIVIINQYWTKLPKINLSFRLSLVIYAYRSIDMTISYRHMKEIIYSRSIPLINNSFVTLDEILTFDQYKDFTIFRFFFECSCHNEVNVISADAALEDIDECNNTSRCPWTNSICENTFGSYLCKCEKGWELGKDGASCVDVNECTFLPLLCSWNNGVCQNFNGSYLCTCQSGWKIGQDNASCVDINECTILPPPCTLINEVCQNTNGSYFCMCDIGWKLGQDNASCVENTSQISAIIGSTLGSVIVLVIVVVIALWIRKTKLNLQETVLNPDIYSLENYMGYEKLPVDKWEISPTCISLDKKIGEGAFGNVFIAKISSNILAKTCYATKTEMVFSDTKASCVNVAVKLLKDGAKQSEFDDFVEEINLMKDIGYHKNIVNLIGCSHVKRPLCLVVEFMENGDLLQFLRKRKTKLIASKTDGDSLASIIFTPTYQNLLQIKDSTHEISIIETEAITPDDLLSFAWQVASGMEYLSCIKLVHRDLAARNILVGANNNAKISDFGLTRKINNDLNYMGCNRRRLPIKWMSVEAIFEHMFTSHSDVWSYGVVLFEIVTLGEIPYPSISNRELVDLLKNGYRMDRPDNCSQFMFDYMLRCWDEDPLQRPTFTELRELFESKLSRSSRYFSFEIEEGSTNLA
ncbi:uncharacterized protein LOC136082398 isoform X3 [Hydra vulgaris]